MYHIYDKVQYDAVKKYWMVCMHHKIFANSKMTNTSDVQAPREIEGASIAMPSTITY